MKVYCNDMLKYFGIVERHVCVKNKITPERLRAMLFLYNEGTIKRSQILEFGSSLGFSMAMIDSMVRAKQIISNRNNYGRRATYMLSPSGVNICQYVYRKLNGQDIAYKYKNIDKDPNELVAFRKEHRELMIALAKITPRQRHRPRR